MATLQASLTGLNQGKRYQRSGWPVSRWVLLKSPGEVEEVTLDQMNAQLTIDGTITTKSLNLVAWLTPEDFGASDYTEEVI